MLLKNEQGIRAWYKKELLHRTNGPAIKWPCGAKMSPTTVVLMKERKSMSEFMGMSIQIGGTLPRKYYKEFLQALNDNLSETSHEISKGVFQANGISNYGECDDLKSFCRDHNLSYIHNSDPKYEYDAEISYWTPELKKEKRFLTTANREETVLVDDVKSLIDLLLAYIKIGPKALTLFIDNEKLKHIIVPALKKKKSDKALIKMLEKKITQLFPTIPDLPPFILKD